MTADEIAETEAAEQCGYEQGEFCHCSACEFAGVTHQAPRFVPRLDRFDKEIARRHPERDVPVILGHWIHGEELKQWYRARGDFYATFAAIGKQLETERRDPTARLARLTGAAAAALSSLHNQSA